MKNKISSGVHCEQMNLSKDKQHSLHPQKKRGEIQYSLVSDMGACGAIMPRMVGSKSWPGGTRLGTPQSCLSVLTHCLPVWPPVWPGYAS